MFTVLGQYDNLLYDKKFTFSGGNCLVYSFKKGIHPYDNKGLTENKSIEVLPVNTVYIPLSQHIGATCEPLVAIGDSVKAGQLIGKSDKNMSSNIFSSISGTVKGFENLPTASGNTILHICIENDFKDEKVFLKPLENSTSQEILERIKEAGIVGMGGASFPTHIKLNPPKDKKIDTLIINGAECEPYITCDYRIMLEYTKEFVEGVRLAAKVLNVEKIYIGIEDNKPLAIKALQGFDNINVIALKSKYPQGAEKQLIYAITKRKVPLCGLPMDIGCVVHNVHTAYSIYQAVAKGQPSYERIVTVSGQAIEKSGNYLVKTGTSFNDIADYCKAKSETVKIVSGGPMMGFSVFNLNIAVSKATSSILFFTKDEINTELAGPCINCGRCAKVCPMYLMPMYIDSYTLVNDLPNAKKYGAMNCIECGCCSYICPTKRPLVQSIRLAKKIIRQKNI